MVLPWHSHAAFMDFRGYSIVFLFPWCVRGAPVVHPWCFYGTPTVACALPLLPWCSHGTSIAPPCDFDGALMVHLCCSHGILTVLPWCSHASFMDFCADSMVFVFVVRPVVHPLRFHAASTVYIYTRFHYCRGALMNFHTFHTTFMVPPWYQYTYDASTGFPWLWHGALMLLLWTWGFFLVEPSMMLPWCAHGTFMVLPWWRIRFHYFHGASMRLFWRLHGAPLVLLWCLHGISLTLPWCFHGRPCEFHGVSFMWHVHGTSVRLSWCLHGTPTVWCFHGAPT